MLNHHGDKLLQVIPTHPVGGVKLFFVSLDLGELDKQFLITFSLV